MDGRMSEGGDGLMDGQMKGPMGGWIYGVGWWVSMDGQHEWADNEGDR